MALRLGALREALLDAGASPEKPNRAAEEVADYEKRLAAIEGKLTMLVWAVGINIAATVASFGMLVTISSRLGEIAQLLRH
jgi:hypothetical protein